VRAGKCWWIVGFVLVVVLVVGAPGTAHAGDYNAACSSIQGFRRNLNAGAELETLRAHLASAGDSATRSGSVRLARDVRAVARAFEKWVSIAYPAADAPPRTTKSERWALVQVNLHVAFVKLLCAHPESAR
jgi:hypothetical protein